MARFVVLKGGQSHAVFEFDGNIARVGAGEAMDLRLEGTEHDGDLFFLAKSGDGYDLERRIPSLNFTVNGQPGSDRVHLEDGDKVAFEDFLVIVTYPASPGRTAAADSQSTEATPRDPAPPQAPPKDTAPIKPPVAPEVESAQPDSAPPPSRPEPPSKQAGGAKETMLIDVEELERRAREQQQQSEPQQSQSQTPAPKQPPPEQKLSPPPPPPPPRGSEKATRIISSEMDRPEPRNEPRQPAQTQPSTPQLAPAQPAGSKSKQKIRAEYSLVGLGGQFKGRAQEIDVAEYVVGRDPKKADLVIDRNEKGELEKSVSREHFAIISSDDGLLYLVDKKSKLRTYINGRVVEPNHRENIAPEDVISIPAPSGEITFRLCYRGQENYEPIKKNTMLIPALILLAVIVILAIILLILLQGD